ncbi:MAG: hypothetical protein NC124_18260 [Clostridium sp.]|nr:hypothetical protein [Clostridium sp.]MCM1564194.1 hypothetical protein [Clostridium sp.]
MKLQDRDYNIILSEEEKQAYEADLAYAALKVQRAQGDFHDIPIRIKR